jgi:anti-sigma B factor antagonist
MAELEGEAGANVVVETRTDQTGATIVSLSGELDSANADALDASLAPLTHERSAQLIFDLSGLRFMDSAGIAVLLGVAAKVSAVRLRDPSPAVRRVIELTGLSDVLRVES